MTLTSAIEAAKNVLEKLTAYIENGKWDEQYGYPRMIQEALAALPEPMTEDQLEGKIGTAIAFYRNDGDSFFLARLIIQELKAANVLFVKEE